MHVTRLALDRLDQRFERRGELCLSEARELTETGQRRLRIQGGEKGQRRIDAGRCQRGRAAYRVLGIDRRGHVQPQVVTGRQREGQRRGQRTDVPRSAVRRTGSQLGLLSGDVAQARSRENVASCREQQRVRGTCAVQVQIPGRDQQLDVSSRTARSVEVNCLQPLGLIDIDPAVGGRGSQAADVGIQARRDVECRARQR